IIAPSSAHLAIQPRHALRVVIENFRPGLDHTLQCPGLANKVGREHFDGSAGPLAHGQYALVKMFGPAVGQIVASDGGNDNVSEAQSGGRLRYALRLVKFERFSLPLGHRTKAAWPRADVAQ